jgi:parallel beta-helix repeat protein
MNPFDMVNLKATLNFLMFFCLQLLLVGCSKSQKFDLMAQDWDNIIKDQVFNNTLILDEDDHGTLIIGATFTDINGDAIFLRNVSNVYIKDCIIYDVTGSGIVLSSLGGTENITIDGCRIYNTLHSGIIAKQNVDKEVDHENLVIKNSVLFNNGSDGHGHNIYMQASDSVIEKNTVYDSRGNGISIRSSGIVRQNKIWGSVKSCIRYFSDNFPGKSNELLIENNVCYLEDKGEGSPGISLAMEDDKPESWIVEKFIIRFNTVVVVPASRFGIAVESEAFDQKLVEVYGNLAMNLEDNQKYISQNYIDYLSNNYSPVSIEEFVNATEKPYDFRLNEYSLVKGKVIGETNFPEVDIKGNPRWGNVLDPGAFQGKQRLIFEFQQNLVPLLLIFASVGILLWIAPKAIMRIRK